MCVCDERQLDDLYFKVSPDMVNQEPAWVGGEPAGQWTSGHIEVY